MTNSRKIRVIVGAGLMLSSLIAMISYAIIQHVNYFIDTKEVVSFMEQIMPERKGWSADKMSNADMPVVSYEKQDFTAIISSERYNVKLPISFAYHGGLLKYMPCRYSGSLYDNTLRVGGSANEEQFGFLTNTDIGDTITITDVRGNVFNFTVSSVVRTTKTLQTALSSYNDDLVLFTKNKKTGGWIMVQCRVAIVHHNEFSPEREA